MFMDAVRGFHAPIRQGASIFVKKNTRKYLKKPLIRSLNGIYWRYSEFSDRHYVAPGVLDASVRNIQCLCALLHVVNEQLREAKREAEALLNEVDAATQPAPEEECPVAWETGTDESRNEETATLRFYDPFPGLEVRSWQPCS